MPTTEQLIEEATQKIIKAVNKRLEVFEINPIDRYTESCIRSEVKAIATKSAEKEREANNLIITATKDAIANGDERLAKEQGFPLFEGEWSSAINLLTYLQEALSREEPHE